MKKLALLLTLVLLLVIGVSVAYAAPEQSADLTANVCPNGGDWVKVDDLDGYTYTYTPPPGFTVTDNCYKHATSVHYGNGPTVEADWHWKIWRYVRYELSHASFLLVPVPVEVCEDEAASNYGEEGECEYPEPTPEITPEITPTTPPNDNRPVCLNYPDWDSLPAGWWRASHDQEPEFTAGFCYLTTPPVTGGEGFPFSLLFVIAGALVTTFGFVKLSNRKA